MAINLNGQNLEQDSTIIAESEEEVPEKKVHSPRKATIYSAILPGLGQAYNKKYWKIPIIYAGFGTIGYYIYWNNDNFNVLKLAYSDLTDGDDNTNSYLDLKPDWIDLDDATDYQTFENGLSNQRDYYRRNRDLLIICIVGFYGLNIIDASVDAHLFDFDISEDLSFNWQPSVHRNYSKQNFYGVNCSFTF